MYTGAVNHSKKRIGVGVSRNLRSGDVYVGRHIKDQAWGFGVLTMVDGTHVEGECIGCYLLILIHLVVLY